MKKKLIALLCSLLAVTLMLPAVAVEKVKKEEMENFSEGVFYVVFASFKNQAEAQKTLDALKNSVDNPLVIREVEIENQTWFKVTSPSSSDNDEIKEAREGVKTNAVPEGWLSQSSDAQAVQSNVAPTAKSDGGSGSQESAYPFRYFGRLIKNDVEDK